MYDNSNRNIQKMRALGVHPDNRGATSADNVCAGLALAMGHGARQQAIMPDPASAETHAAVLRMAGAQLPRTMPLVTTSGDYAQLGAQKPGR